MIFEMVDGLRHQSYDVLKQPPTTSHIRTQFRGLRKELIDGCLSSSERDRGSCEDLSIFRETCVSIVGIGYLDELDKPSIDSILYIEL